NVDFLTIGQYLQPTRKHAAVARFVPPDEFEAYRRVALSKGFLMVAASPLTRSSYHAGDDFARLRAARAAAAPAPAQVRDGVDGDSLEIAVACHRFAPPIECRSRRGRCLISLRTWRVIQPFCPCARRRSCVGASSTTGSAALLPT